MRMQLIDIDKDLLSCFQGNTRQERKEEDEEAGDGPYSSCLNTTVSPHRIIISVCVLLLLMCVSVCLLSQR